MIVCVSVWVCVCLCKGFGGRVCPVLELLGKPSAWPELGGKLSAGGCVKSVLQGRGPGSFRMFSVRFRLSC